MKSKKKTGKKVKGKSVNRQRKRSTGKGLTRKSKAKAKTSKSKPKKSRTKRGKGLINSIINKLPFEAHIPGYQYCGPGTNLEKRLKRNDPGINELDRACKAHDIAYSQTNDVAERNQADKVLAKKAWERVKSKDAKLSEKAAALSVAGIMKAKSKMGMGVKKQSRCCKKKKSSTKSVPQIFRKAIKNAKSEIKNQQPKTIPNAVKLAIQAAKVAVKNHKISKSVAQSGIPRIIPVPKIGGVLPLIPIFAGLSALGALMGGSAGVANAVISANKAKKDFKEAQRHNQTMEAIAIGGKKMKNGNGLYLMPYKKGLGLFLSPYSKNL